ncbi:hypothetical protein [Baaleninema simplex]|nr:hypothetical protein [Baaleninema simplex]
MKSQTGDRILSLSFSISNIVFLNNIADRAAIETGVAIAVAKLYN